MRKIAIILVVSFFCGCAYQLEPLEKEKRMLYHLQIKSIAVIPFVNHTAYPELTDSVTTIFTEELARFNEVGILHSQTVYRYILENKLAIDEKTIHDTGLTVGNALGVETVLVGVITEYNPYFPPKLGISYEILEVKSGKSLFSWSETYDASYNYVRENLDLFAQKKKNSDSVLGKDIILRKRDLFIQFVCHELIRKNL